MLAPWTHVIFLKLYAHSICSLSPPPTPLPTPPAAPPFSIIKCTSAVRLNRNSLSHTMAEPSLPPSAAAASPLSEVSSLRHFSRTPVSGSNATISLPHLSGDASSWSGESKTKTNNEPLIQNHQNKQNRTATH